MNFLELMKTEIIKLFVKPNSSNTCIDGMYMDRIKIKVSSPPEKGKANKELIKFISYKLSIPKKDINIISGKKSKLKSIALKCDDAKQNLESKLLH